MNTNRQTFVLDRANFPMVWSESLKAYIHLLPVTKIQYEYFLWDAPNPGLDQTWYETVTKDNGRITPEEVNGNNYWRIFMSTLLPSEAQYYLDWCAGQSNDARYAIPTQEEWQSAYKSFKEQLNPSLLEDAREIPGLSPRCQTILKKLGDLFEGRDGAEQLLLVNGLMEWVVGKDQPWGLFGYPHQRFAVLGRHPDTGRALTPGNPNNPNDPKFRHKAYGFRLLRKNSG